LGEESVFRIADIACPPGQRARGRIVAGWLDDGSPVEVPLLVLHGTRPGPVFWLGAALHGIEIVGAEIIRRVVWEDVDPTDLAGTIVGAPIQNPLAFLDHRYNTPRDGLNINRFFPGNPKGSISEQLAYALYTEGIAKSDIVVDIHANTAPAHPFAILRTGSDPVYARARTLASAYGLTILESAPKPLSSGEKHLAGLLMDAALHDGKPAVTLEYECWTIDDRWVQAGTVGTLNALKRFEMLPGEEQPVPFVTKIAESLAVQVALRASAGGVMHHLTPPGTRVAVGEPVARIVDLYGDERELFRSPVDGYVMCFPRYLNQTAATGDEVVYIAPVQSGQTVARPGVTA
jgi:predicted deacylase